MVGRHGSFEQGFLCVRELCLTVTVGTSRKEFFQFFIAEEEKKKH